MTDYAGLAAPEIFEMSRTKSFSFPPEGTTPDHSGILADLTVGLGSAARVTRAENTKKDSAGVGLNGGGADDIIFERVYFTPKKIDEGIITEDTEHEITIWNSSFVSTVDITQILQSNADGTILQHNGTPETIQKNYETKHKVTVLKEGPPVQATEYAYTVGSLEFIIEITGIRVIVFNHVPNTNEDEEREFVFITVVERNERFVEQRRPMLDVPLRRTTAKFSFVGKQWRKFINDIRKLSVKIVAIPVSMEQLTPSTDLQGLTSIPLNQATANYSDLNNRTQFILLRSKSNLFLSELKGIATIGSNSIDVDIPVVENFTAADTEIYPCFIGLIENWSPDVMTDEAGEGQITFREIEVYNG